VTIAAFTIIGRSSSSFTRVARIFAAELAIPYTFEIVRDLQSLVVDAGAITALDYSAALTLSDLIADLRERKVVVIFGRVNPYLRADMDRHRITQIVGESNIFDTLHEALAAAGISPPREVNAL